MTQTAADQKTEKATRPVGRPRTTLKPRDPDGRNFVPLLPTSGADLMGAWSLHTSAWTDARLKVSRKMAMSEALELVDETTVEEFDLQSLAAHYGPGSYHLILSPSPSGLWPSHNCKIPVSAEYARKAGYLSHMERERTPEIPRMADARALGVVSQAITDGRPMTTADMAMLMETIVERTARAVREAMPPPPPASPASVDGMMNLFGVLQTMQRETKLETIEMFKMMQGRDPEPAPAEPTEMNWLNLLGPALQAVVSMVKPAAPAVQPVAEPARPALSSSEPEPVEINVNLTSNEIADLAPAAAMLKPHAGIIVSLIQRNTDDQAVADQLAPYIPAALAPLLVRLADLSEQRGPSVLGIISPDLQTERGRTVVLALRSILKP